MDASWDPACFCLRPPLHRRRCMLFPEARAHCHHRITTHAYGTDSWTPGRSDGAGQTAEVSPWIRGTEPPDRFLCGQSCRPFPGSHATDFLGGTAPRQEWAPGSVQAEGGHLEMDLLSEDNETGPLAVLCLP